MKIVLCMGLNPGEVDIELISSDVTKGLSDMCGRDFAKFMYENCTINFVDALMNEYIKLDARYRNNSNIKKNIIPPFTKSQITRKLILD